MFNNRRLVCLSDTDFLQLFGFVPPKPTPCDGMLEMLPSAPKMDINLGSSASAVLISFNILASFCQMPS
jgi:hypothetical protein